MWTTSTGSKRDHFLQADLDEAARAADAAREVTEQWLPEAEINLGHKEVPVTHLRKMMLEELQRRNYAQTTIRSYIRIVEDFSRRYQCAPNCLGPKHIREYQSELFTKRKFAASTVTVYLAALRFFYIKTLKRVWGTTETPYPKRVFSLPTVLSREEVAQLIDAARTPYHRTLLMTLYATGVRRAELTHLKVTDVDSRDRKSVL